MYYLIFVIYVVCWFENGKGLDMISVLDWYMINEGVNMMLWGGVDNGKGN